MEYADLGINIYYLIAAIYGWFFWMWGHRKKKSQQSADASTGDKPKDLPIVHTPWKCYLPLFQGKHMRRIFTVGKYDGFGSIVFTYHCTLIIFFHLK